MKIQCKSFIIQKKNRQIDIRYYYTPFINLNIVSFYFFGKKIKYKNLSNLQYYQYPKNDVPIVCVIRRNRKEKT